MTKIGFAQAFDEQQEIAAAWGSIPDKSYSPHVEGVFVREFGSATVTLLQSPVETPEDAAAVIKFMLTDTALCDRPELLRKVLPFLTTA